MDSFKKRRNYYTFGVCLKRWWPSKLVCIVIENSNRIYVVQKIFLLLRVLSTKDVISKNLHSCIYFSSSSLTSLGRLVSITPCTKRASVGTAHRPPSHWAMWWLCREYPAHIPPMCTLHPTPVTLKCWSVFWTNLLQTPSFFFKSM